jgi:hypothetical protein
MNNFKKDLVDLERSIGLVLKRGMFPKGKKYETFDYEEKQRAYLKREIELKAKKIIDLLNKPDSKNISFLKKLDEFQRNFEEVQKEINKFSPESLEKSVDLIERILEKFPEQEKIENKEFTLPQLPKEIKQEIQSDFEELLICFENNCFRSSLILCGKILEIALHRKYFEVTGKDLLEKSPDIGLGNLLAKMRESNISFDPGLPQQIHLINQLRVFSVHKKAQAFQPSKEQAKAAILYTIDILNKLFSN